VSEPILVATRDMIVNSCRQEGRRLSRVAILPNHIHISVGCGIEESPESVGLSMLHNLACTQGMRTAFKFGYYVGTVGNFDRNAIWNRLESWLDEPTK
jgi:REP element-mobilizing transposase RayT